MAEIRKLGRKTDHRLAMLKNLTTSGTYILFAKWQANSVNLYSLNIKGYTFNGWYDEN